MISFLLSQSGLDISTVSFPWTVFNPDRETPSPSPGGCVTGRWSLKAQPWIFTCFIRSLSIFSAEEAEPIPTWLESSCKKLHLGMMSATNSDICCLSGTFTPNGVCNKLYFHFSCFLEWSPDDWFQHVVKMSNTFLPCWPDYTLLPLLRLPGGASSLNPQKMKQQLYSQNTTTNCEISHVHMSKM